MKTLEGQVAIVTGGAQGIGYAIAEELALAGASIAVFDLKLDPAQSAASALSANGVTARGYAVDVSNSKLVDDSFAQVVADFGRLDIVINNAGVSFVGPHIKDVTDEVWNTSGRDHDDARCSWRVGTLRSARKCHCTRSPAHTDVG